MVTFAELLVAVGVVVQMALLVRTTLTRLPVVSVDEVKVEPVCPGAATPFTIH